MTLTDAEHGKQDNLAATKAEHRGEPGGECNGDDYDCGFMWPCPTWRLADRAEKAEAERDAILNAIDATKIAPGVAVEIRGVRIESCDTYGATMTTRQRDEALAKVTALTSALQRTERNFRSAVYGVPVRDMAENLAENATALGELQP